SPGVGLDGVPWAGAAPAAGAAGAAGAAAGGLLSAACMVKGASASSMPAAAARKWRGSDFKEGAAAGRPASRRDVEQRRSVLPGGGPTVVPTPPVRGTYV